jgi:hypothetical protein
LNAAMKSSSVRFCGFGWTPHMSSCRRDVTGTKFLQSNVSHDFAARHDLSVMQIDL